MFTSASQLLGTAAAAYGVLAALAVLLQARQMLARRTSCDVSGRFFACYADGYALWLAYGLSSGNVPLIVVDAVGLLCGGLTLAVALSLRGSLARPAHRGLDRPGHCRRQPGHADPEIPPGRYLRHGPGQPPPSPADRFGSPGLERRPASPAAADALPDRGQPHRPTVPTARRAGLLTGPGQGTGVEVVDRRADGRRPTDAVVDAHVRIPSVDSAQTPRRHRREGPGPRRRSRGIRGLR
jgi:MtN3 and saliva related transmembrane protein